MQAFHLASNEVQSSTKVFPLIRGSRLAAGAYLDAFFDTGSEHEGHSQSEGVPGNHES